MRIFGRRLCPVQMQIRRPGINCLREAGATVNTQHADHPDANVRRPGDAIIPVPDRDFLFSGFRKYLWTRRDAHRRPNAQVPGGSSFMG